MATGTLNRGGYDEVRIERGDGKRTVSYLRDGVLNRDGGPAVECSDGTKLFYRNGVLHRDGGPAVITSLGDEAWFTLGVRRPPQNFHGMKGRLVAPHTTRP